MGGQNDRIGHKEGSVVAGSNKASGIGSKRPGDAPDLLVATSEEAELLRKGYRYLGYVPVLLVVGFVHVILSFVTITGWSMVLLEIVVYLGIAIVVWTGGKALREAIASETERLEEIAHYRKLSQEICLREFRKGGNYGRSQ